MSRLLTIFLFSLLFSPASAQEVLLQLDNNAPKGSHSNLPSFSEESFIIKPDGPCQVLEVRILYAGSMTSRDTLWFVGDPSEGAVPPTAWVWSYNYRINPVAVQFSGQPGWVTVDLRGQNLRSNGYDRIVIQHQVKPSGPWFTVDSDGMAQPYSSFLMDPTKTNSLGGPGQYYLAAGDFMIRVLVQYDYPFGQTSASPPVPTLFDFTKQAGITDASGNPLKTAIASVGDWNNDGFDDINIGSNYFQNNGNGTFTNVSSIVNMQGDAVWGDYDNDGLIDAYTANGGDYDNLWKNNGDGTFTDVTSASKLVNPYPTVTPIWLDFNNDGQLDLFIANGRKEVSGVETYFPDQLWKNNGDGTFVNVTVASRISAAEPSPYYDCWGASACDYNNDGYTDIFVSTYRLAPDLLYRNNGNGTFTEVGAQTGVRGVATAAPQYFGHGMGSDWGDFDNDGFSDLVVGNLGHPDWRGSVSNPSLIFHNNGGSVFNFTEMHRSMGLKFFEMNAGAIWADLDHDGYLDLWQSQYAYNPDGSNGEPQRLSHVYINDGPPNFNLLDKTWDLGSLIHGAWTVVRTDYDNDGDLDLLVASPTEAVKLFRNDMPKRGRWLGIRLNGSPQNNVNRDAFGTTVRVYADGGAKKYIRTLSTNAAGSRAAVNTCELHFGLGHVVNIDSVVLSYPNGFSRAYTNLLPDHKYRIPYNGDVTTEISTRSVPVTWTVTNVQYTHGRIRFTLSTLNVLHTLSVEVYNTLGIRVASWASENVSSGVQYISLDKAPATGVYFLRLTSGDRSQALKFLIGT